jgi:hypothetical protein
MIVLVEHKLDRALIVGIVWNKKVGAISYENILLVKSTLFAEHPYHVITKPPYQGICIGVLSHLAEKVLVAGCLPVIMVLR